jgi:DNA-binding MarR family transcriptional regulator
MASTPGSPSRDTVLDDLPFHLARAGLAFRRFNHRTLHAIGLKPQAPGLASVLHALEENDDCTVNRLVEQTQLPNGTLTGLLDALEQDGCIERVRNPDDGRSWRIRLTKSGRRLCEKLQQRHRAVMGLFRDALSEAEMVELKRLLAQVTARMRAYRAEDGAPLSGTAKRRSAATVENRLKHAKPKP